MTAGWTDDRVGALKKLWLEGQSASQIAKQLGGGVTRNAVIGKVHRLGLSGRAAPSQPARTVAATFRTTRPRPAAAAPAPAPTQPSAPRRLEAVQPKPVQPAAPVPAPMPDLPGTATVMTLGAHMCKWPIGDPSSREFQLLRPPRLGRRLLRRTRPRRLPAPGQARQGRLVRPGPQPASLHLSALSRFARLKRGRFAQIPLAGSRKQAGEILGAGLRFIRVDAAPSAFPLVQHSPRIRRIQREGGNVRLETTAFRIRHRIGPRPWSRCSCSKDSPRRRNSWRRLRSPAAPRPPPARRPVRHGRDRR